MDERNGPEWRAINQPATMHGVAAVFHAPDRAVLWDLDGTLIDSEAYHWRSWLETMRAEGRDLECDVFQASFGQRNDRILSAWLGPDATPARIARIADAKETAYRRLMRAGGLDWLPGVPAWIRRLEADGWKQAIASSAPRLNIEAVLDVLGRAHPFAAVVSAEDVPAGKPAPDVFLAAATRLGVAPARCVVVEDAPAGIEAARRAGMRSIGIRGAAEAGPDVSAESVAHLPPEAFESLVAAGAHSSGRA